MPDGSVYAGISPATTKPMYAMPADASLKITFNEAAEHAKATNSQKAHGHDDWRVPTKAELNVLFNNRAAIGGFKLTDASLYWAVSQTESSPGWAQRFSTGYQDYCNEDKQLFLRCVR